MCECMKKVDEELARSNTVLDKQALINMETGGVRETIVIATLRRDRSQRRTKVKKIIPTFCPFCGGRLKAAA
jgi:hypothetical protein